MPSARLENWYFAANLRNAVDFVDGLHSYEYISWDPISDLNFSCFFMFSNVSVAV
jgi:hypothetical protein